MAEDNELPAGTFTAGDYNNRGSTYRAFKQYDLALADYDRALELDPNDALAYLNIGSLLAYRRQFPEALSYFEEAAQLGLP